MTGLTGFLQNLREYTEVTGNAQGGTLALSGLCSAAKAQVAAAYAMQIGRPALVVVPDEAAAARMAEDLEVFLGEGCEVFPYRDINFFEAQSVSHELESQRLRVLGMLRHGTLKAAVCTPDAAMTFLLPSDAFDKGSFALYEGNSYNMDDLCLTLVEAGYVRVDRVDAPGQFSRRGDLLDLFVPSADRPVRVEFWGDEVDSVSRFSVDTQRRGERISNVLVSPAREMPCDKTLSAVLRQLAGTLPGDAPVKEKLLTDADKAEGGLPLPWADKYLPLRYGEHTLFDYADFSLIVSEFHRVRDRAEAYMSRLNEDLLLLADKGLLLPSLRYCLSPGEFLARLEKDTLLLDEFPRGSYPMPLAAYAQLPCTPCSLWKGSMEDLYNRLYFVKEGGTAVLFCGTAKAAGNVAKDMVANGFTAASGKVPDTLQKGTVYCLPGRLTEGMEYPTLSLCFLSFTRPDDKGKRRVARAAGQRIAALTDISSGDAVVHAVHGVGIYQGVNKVEVQGVVKDYLNIRYAGGDTLYVPVTQLDLVSRYIGDEEGVRLSKMGGTDWNKAKARVRSSVRDMAKELIDLYARRLKKKGHAFAADGAWQQDFESHFEYTETDDQLAAIRDIKKDMEKPVPMDRLLCGDVGFGKTEVALRAAFKCVAEGKQVAILVPTTLLAWQHYQTVMRRMEGFGLRVGLLCRFRSKKQQEETVRELAAGKIDIAVGTHRLVQKDIRFHDLGLIIIDEEQRFGVAQKEFLKNKYDSVDCLSLSATPIPRTLNMALSGIRDMSCIEEAPGGRQPIQTYVTEYDGGMIAETVRRELRRGGQVYYLHNNTETIDRKAYQLSQLLPEAKIGVAHGKMNETALSAVWEDLIDRRIDVLVCTTIIETGVDVPNANTLIIEDADRMGLSQLHQIRGRIGRSYRTAYAYFTFRPGKAVSDIAAKRLDAIREFTEFGSGFRIALRDLEIRGAGNVLGGEQSGHMDAVGYDMYVKLLNEAISEELGQPQKQEIECTVDLPVTAHIPETYISQSQRIDVYRRIAAIRTPEDGEDVLDELIDRYGDPPIAVTSLIRVALCRQKAKTLQITDITQREALLMLYPVAVSPAVTAALSAAYGNRLRVNAGAKPYYGVKIDRTDVLSAAEEVLTVMESATESGKTP